MEEDFVGRQGAERTAVLEGGEGREVEEEEETVRVFWGIDVINIRCT